MVSPASGEDGRRSDAHRYTVIGDERRTPLGECDDCKVVRGGKVAFQRGHPPASVHILAGIPRASA